MHRLASRLVLAAACTTSLRAWAGGPGELGTAPRAIGRAGTGLVADDGGWALLVDPAALARRDAWRVQLGLALGDDAMEWASRDSSAPLAHDQAGSQLAPLLAAEGGVGGFVVGIGAMTSSVRTRSFASPAGISPDLLGHTYDDRYSGIASAWRRDTIALAAARRISDAVAVGLGVAGSRVAIGETRSIWAGQPGRDVTSDATQDIVLDLAAHDAFVPSAVASVFVAPNESHVELAASVAWSRTVHAAGTFGAGSGSAVALARAAPNASIDVVQPLVVRSGMRYLAERWSIELDTELSIVGDNAAATSWTLDGASVTDTSSGAIAALPVVPSRISIQTHGAVRGAGEVELIEGLLAVTAGYAYRTPSVAPSRQSTTFGDLGGHTAAAGIEVTAGGFAITIGWSREWSRSRTIPNSSWHLDDPFGAAPAIPAGRYDGSIDTVGVAVDAEF